MDRKLIIFGLGETADIAYEYFKYDSNYDVIGFTAEDQFITQDEYHNLPVFPFNEVTSKYSPEDVDFFVAISYTQLNRVREKCYTMVKQKGYKCANYISSKAFVWHNVEIGENVMIFENNVIQHQVKIGNGVILWSGNHIGHQSIIEDFVYIASHAVISGFCKLGAHSFVGVNATFNDNITIAADTIVGSGSLVVKNFEEPGKVLVGSPARPISKTSYETFGVKNN